MSIIRWNPTKEWRVVFTDGKGTYAVGVVVAPTSIEQAGLEAVMKSDGLKIVKMECQ
jgi:hypothetical protein